MLPDTERAGTLYPLGSEVPRIGKAPDNDVVLDHPTVSRNHLVRAFEREYRTRLLTRTKGNIARAAREAELERKHLCSLPHKYGLVQSDEG